MALAEVRTISTCPPDSAARASARLSLTAFFKPTNTTSRSMSHQLERQASVQKNTAVKQPTNWKQYRDKHVSRAPTEESVDVQLSLVFLRGTFPYPAYITYYNITMPFSKDSHLRN